MKQYTFLAYLNSRHAAMALVAVLGTAVGCAPSGNTGGRIDPYETTSSDLKSQSISLPALLQFGDQTAQQLATDLHGIDQISGRKTRAVLEIGTLVNKTHTPTQDFEQLQLRLRNRLQQSQLMRDQFLIVEGGSRMDAEKDRTEGSGTPDLLQDGAAPQGTDRYAAQDTFVLQGDFYESRRGERSQYYISFQLTNVKTREIVFNHDYDLGQMHGEH